MLVLHQFQNLFGQRLVILQHILDGEFDFFDFEKVLSFNTGNAMALYGRGVAKMKVGDIAGGSTDIAAAQRINPNVRVEFEPGG